MLVDFDVVWWSLVDVALYCWLWVGAVAVALVIVCVCRPFCYSMFLRVVNVVVLVVLFSARVVGVVVLAAVLVAVAVVLAAGSESVPVLFVVVVLLGLSLLCCSGCCSLHSTTLANHKVAPVAPLTDGMTGGDAVLQQQTPQAVILFVSLCLGLVQTCHRANIEF